VRKLDSHFAKSLAGACPSTRASPSTRAGSGTRASPCTRAGANARADADASTCAGCCARIGVDESSFG